MCCFNSIFHVETVVNKNLNIQLYNLTYLQLRSPKLAAVVKIFFVEIDILVKKKKFWSKIIILVKKEILVKNRNFGKKRNVGQKCLVKKIEILVKNRNFR